VSEGLKYVGMTIDELRKATGADRIGSGDFGIGSRMWPGISKLIEEAGEVTQVCGKLLGSSGVVDHWDGTNLKDELQKELADLSAAIEFVIQQCCLDAPAIRERTDKKLDLFEQWHLNNLK